MADCEMCGRRNVKLVKVKIENTNMNVCTFCANYGKILAEPKETFSQNKRKYKKVIKEKKEEYIVDNYANLVRQAREKRGLKQEEVAKKINEKESVIHNIESGNFRPSIALAKKIGKFYNIKLIEEPKEESVTLKSSSEGQPLTMGDILKNAMKK